MRKGKFGICLWFYAVLAFILAFLGQTLLGGLLLGFVIIAEKDEWLDKQVIQAFFLGICGSILNAIINVLDSLRRLPFAGTIFSTVLSVISGLISLVVLIFVIIGIVRTAKGHDADIPGLSTLADRALGYIKQKIQYQQQPMQQQQPMNNQPMQQQPIPQPQPVPQPQPQQPQNPQQH